MHTLLSAIHGQPHAICCLVESLRPRLTRMAAYYARHTGQDPDDLLQEAYFGLLEAVPELDVTIGTPAQYLIARARWRMLDAVRRTRLRNTIPQAALQAARADADLSFLHVSGAIDLADFLETLGPLHRAILTHLLDGLTWRETAARIGCSSANIAYHLRLIRQRYQALNPEHSAA